MPKKKTHEQFCKEIYNLVGNEYSILSKYINSCTKLSIIHNTCEYIFETIPNNFLQGNRCPNCRYKNLSEKISKTYEQFLFEIFQLEGDNYSVLENYIGNHIKIKFKHNICGHIYKATPNNFLRSGTRCPKCNKGVKKTTEEFKKEVYNFVKDEYTVLGKYINNNTLIPMRHNLCGHIWNIRPKHFVNSNSRCPQCNESKGEQVIRYLLKNKSEIFDPQYTFDDLKDIDLLRFDFVLFNNKEKTKIKCAIEYDGEGHFSEKPFGKKAYEKTIKHDQMKNDYCNKNNILLLRIPYWEFDNIENILDNYLLNNNLEG